MVWHSSARILCYNDKGGLRAARHRERESKQVIEGAVFEEREREREREIERAIERWLFFFYYGEQNNAMRGNRLFTRASASTSILAYSITGARDNQPQAKMSGGRGLYAMFLRNPSISYDNLTQCTQITHPKQTRTARHLFIR